MVVAQTESVMRIESDPRADSVYIYLSDKKVKVSKELTSDVVVDFAEDGSIVGFDFQHVAELVREKTSKKHAKMQKEVRHMDFRLSVV